MEKYEARGQQFLVRKLHMLTIPVRHKIGPKILIPTCTGYLAEKVEEFKKEKLRTFLYCDEWTLL
jgi:hypothetical protein